MRASTAARDPLLRPHDPLLDPHRGSEKAKGKQSARPLIRLIPFSLRKEGWGERGGRGCKGGAENMRIKRNMRSTQRKDGGNSKVRSGSEADQKRIGSGSAGIVKVARAHLDPCLPPLKIRLLPGAQIPAYATEGAAGLDLKARVGGIVMPGEVMRVPTGLCLEIPAGTMGEVRPRSGLASRGILAVVGTIDSDYRGEVQVMLHNATGAPWRFSWGDRIAQLVIVPVIRVEPVVVDQLSETERGDRGFGSTGR